MDELVNAVTGMNFDPIGFLSDEGGAIQKGLLIFTEVLHKCFRKGKV